MQRRLAGVPTDNQRGHAFARRRADATLWAGALLLSAAPGAPRAQLQPVAPHQIQILIVEDDFGQALALRRALVELGYAVVGVASTASEAEEMFAASNPDLLLLDIQLLPGLAAVGQPADATSDLTAEPADGVALARRLLARQPVPVVFLTAHPEAATFERARALTPFAFLIKPWQPLQLRYTLELAVQHFVQEQGRQALTISLSDGSALLPAGFFLREPGRYSKLRLADLLALEADGTYVHLHTPNQRKYTLRVPLRELEEHLAPLGFVRVHRSWMVAFGALETVAYGLGEVGLTGGLRVPLGRTYHDGLRRYLPR